MSRVADPDPVGSGPFCRIRIRKFSTGSGSFPSYMKLYNTIICKLKNRVPTYHPVPHIFCMVYDKKKFKNVT